MKKIFLTFIFSLVLISLWAIPVMTADYTASLNTQLNSAAGTSGADFGDVRDPRFLAAEVIRIILGLIGTIFLAYTVYAGVSLMISGGDEEQIKKSQRTLTYSVLGIIIAFSAFGIALLVERYMKDALRAPEKGMQIKFETEANQGGYYSKDPYDQGGGARIDWGAL